MANMVVQLQSVMRIDLISPAALHYKSDIKAFNISWSLVCRTSLHGVARPSALE